MINFRYHVVSLTAVFLSLAVGLVLGSTVLNGPMLDALENRVSTMGRENSQLREQVGFLEEEVSREQVWATEAAPALLSGTLAARRVGLVVTPSGEEYAEAVVEKLELAGATITGTLTITDKFTHPQHRLNELLDLAHRSLPASVDGDSLPHNSDGVETSAALLAAILFDQGPPAPEQPGDADDADDAAGDDDTDDPAGDDDAGGSDNGTAAPRTVPAAERRTVLSAYTTLDYLGREDWDQAAELIVMVTGLPASDSDADERNDAILTTVAQFGLAGPVVLAGVGQAGDGNVVTAVRTNPELAAEISTVDNSGTPQGQVATGLAAGVRLSGEIGHYGSGDRADSMLPLTDG